MAHMRAYSYFGTILLSPIALEALPQIEGCGPFADEVTLSIGELPEKLDCPVWSNHFLSIDRQGDILISINGIGRFLVSRGSSVVFFPVSGVRSDQIESLIISIVAGALLHQRGVLTIHASCLEVGEKIIAITGVSGRGKSTLALALIRQRAQLICEDITALRFGTGGVFVLQGAFGVRLREDSVNALGRPEEDWELVGNKRPKQRQIFGSVASEPVKLSAILRLTIEDENNPVGLKRLHLPAAVRPYSQIVYRPNLARRLGTFQNLVRGMTKLAREVPVFELSRPSSFERIGEAVNLVKNLSISLDR